MVLSVRLVRGSPCQTVKRREAQDIAKTLPDCYPNPGKCASGPIQTPWNT